jgi:hypothetical protein
MSCRCLRPPLNIFVRQLCHLPEQIYTVPQHVLDKLSVNFGCEILKIVPGYCSTEVGVVVVVVVAVVVVVVVVLVVRAVVIMLIPTTTPCDKPRAITHPLPPFPQVDARLSFNTEASIAKGRALIALCVCLSQTPASLSHFPTASPHPPIVALSHCLSASHSSPATKLPAYPAAASSSSSPPRGRASRLLR